MPELIDLYSDTHTLPTDAMRAAMVSAEVGDDCNRTDPTVNRLEEMAAAVVGKEAAVFCPSGTMANLAALLAATHHGDEVVLERTSHLYWYESGGYAAVAGVALWAIDGERGQITAEQVRASLRPTAENIPRPRVIWVENTHNRGGGSVYPLERLAGIRELARERKLWVHMDGARVFNAAAALGCDAREITRHADSVQFCLSKGLGAPIGSLVAADAAFILEVRRKRRMLGGGMRQAGVVAAAGIVALQEGPGRLARDHEHARLLGEILADVPGLRVVPPETNLLFVNVDPAVAVGAELHRALRDNGLWVSLYGPQQLRMVTYHQVDEPTIRRAAGIVRDTVAAFAGRAPALAGR